MTELIRVENLSLGYGRRPIVENISFTIEPGDFVAIVGANGSGKSTLVKTLLGLLSPLAGKITLADGLKIGYLPQETRIDANFPATVREIVLSGTLGRLGFKPFYSQAERALAATALKTLKLTRLADKSFSDLSGGQKQKVLLARALAASANLLILDEPSNNLDHDSRLDFYETLRNLNKNSITILMITHDLDADDLIGNKVLSIRNHSVFISKTTDYLQHFHPTHAILDSKTPAKESR